MNRCLLVVVYGIYMFRFFMLLNVFFLLVVMLIMMYGMLLIRIILLIGLCVVLNSLWCVFWLIMVICV